MQASKTQANFEVCILTHIQATQKEAFFKEEKEKEEKVPKI